MKCALKSANVMIVIFWVFMICGLTAAIIPLPDHSSSQLSSLADKSESLPLNNSNQNKNDTSSASLGAATLLSKKGNKADEKSSVSCKTKPCSGTDEKSNLTKVPTSTSSQEESSQPMTLDGNKDLRKLNPEALIRGLYVFAGLSVIVMLYIAWKSFGKRPAQVHRYGVITNREDLEMAPLDSDDGDGDEDDTTHFDLSKHRLK